MTKKSTTRKAVLAAFGLSLTLGMSQAWADTVTTTKTTTYSGVVSDLSPSSSIIVKSEESGPKTYVLTEKTTYLDPEGNVVTASVLRGKPVTVYYTQEGDRLVASKVIVTKPAGGTVTERTETYQVR